MQGLRCTLVICSVCLISILITYPTIHYVHTVSLKAEIDDFKNVITWSICV